MQEKPKHGALWTIFFSMISIAWVFPIFLVLLNSFKGKAYISRNAFAFPGGRHVRRARELQARH